jgi:hypothetical protein
MLSLTLQFTINAKPTLSQPSRPSASQFQFLVQGVAGQNYTIQASSNLINWNSFLVTNPPTGVFTVSLGNATNRLGFYRVLVGP